MEISEDILLLPLNISSNSGHRIFSLKVCHLILWRILKTALFLFLCRNKRQMIFLEYLQNFFTSDIQKFYRNVNYDFSGKSIMCKLSLIYCSLFFSFHLALYLPFFVDCPLEKCIKQSVFCVSLIQFSTLSVFSFWL